MKAAVLTKINEPLVLEELQRPYNLSYGQVLVEVLCTGICGAQLQEIDGRKGDPKHLPHLLGHEGCGMVRDAGPGVRIVSPGDKVVLHWRKGTGIDADPASYEQGTIKSGPITTFSKWAVISENRLTKIPSDMPDELGALFGCALSTALAVVENVAKIRFGEKILIVGCGGVGLSLMLAAKLAHAYPIYGIDINYEHKRKWITDLGGIILSAADATTKFDVIIDTVGDAQWFSSLGPSGRYILVGQPRNKLTIDERFWFTGEGQTLTATQGGNFNPTLDIPRYVNLWRSGALANYKSLISHQLCLDHINEGIALMREGKAARVMIFP